MTHLWVTDHAQLKRPLAPHKDALAVTKRVKIPSFPSALGRAVLKPAAAAAGNWWVTELPSTRHPLCQSAVSAPLCWTSYLRGQSLPAALQRGAKGEAMQGGPTPHAWGRTEPARLYCQHGQSERTLNWHNSWEDFLHGIIQNFLYSKMSKVI